MSDAVTVVLALKPLAGAKSRMAARLPAPQRAELALAMAADTVTAVGGEVARVIVVAARPREAEPLARLGADVVADVAGGGLNAAFDAGADIARDADPHGIVAALQADLPALRPGMLTSAVTEAAGNRAFCPDRHHRGTTLLLSAPAGALRPRFGPTSAAAHRSSGAVQLHHCATALRCDVDTPADLDTAMALGIRTHTAQIVGPQPPRPDPAPKSFTDPSRPAVPRPPRVRNNAECE